MLGKRGLAAAQEPWVVANPDDERVRTGGGGLMKDECDGRFRLVSKS
jgi:hypothetical protein